MIARVAAVATPLAEPGLTLVAPLRTAIEVVREPEAVAPASAEQKEAPRPTLARPQAAATGLFQGWGPRLG